MPEIPYDHFELLCAIGEMTVEATRLEHHVAYAVALSRNEDDACLRRTLRKPGDALAALQAEAARQTAESPLAGLVRPVKGLLADRSVVVHSVAFFDTTGGGEPQQMWWHPRSDVERKLTPAEVRELAHELRRMGVQAMEAGNEAVRSRSRPTVGDGG